MLTLAQVRHWLETVERVHGPAVPVLAVLPGAPANGAWSPRRVPVIDMLLALEAARPVVVLVAGVDGGGRLR